MQKSESLLVSGVADTTPPRLKGYRDAPAYFGILSRILAQHAPDPDVQADLAIAFEEAIEQHKVRDWVGNRDVENKMKLALDDLLYAVTNAHAWSLSDAEQDAILGGIIDVAGRRDGLR